MIRRQRQSIHNQLRDAIGETDGELLDGRLPTSSRQRRLNRH